jgi:hypothetical protein
MQNKPDPAQLRTSYLSNKILRRTPKPREPITLSIKIIWPFMKHFSNRFSLYIIIIIIYIQKIGRSIIFF